MSAVEPLCNWNTLLKIDKKESYILEVNLFIEICRELKEIFRAENIEYFKLLNNDLEKENRILEKNFIRFVIKDILSTESYSLTGIACYTNTPQEVILELAMGCNTNPSYCLVRKIIELHRSVKIDLYNRLIAKILNNKDTSNILNKHAQCKTELKPKDLNSPLIAE